MVAHSPGCAGSFQCFGTFPWQWDHWKRFKRYLYEACTRLRTILTNSQVFFNLFQFSTNLLPQVISLILHPIFPRALQKVLAGEKLIRLGVILHPFILSWVPELFLMCTYVCVMFLVLFELQRVKRTLMVIVSWGWPVVWPPAWKSGLYQKIMASDGGLAWPRYVDKRWRALPHWCPATQAAKWLPKLMT